MMYTKSSLQCDIFRCFILSFYRPLSVCTWIYACTWQLSTLSRARGSGGHGSSDTKSALAAVESSDFIDLTGEN